jgi:hypothetical protein
LVGSFEQTTTGASWSLRAASDTLHLPPHGVGRM